MQLNDLLAVLLLHVLCFVPGPLESLEPTQTTENPNVNSESTYLPSDNSSGCRVLFLDAPSIIYFYSDSCRQVPRNYQFTAQQIAIKSTKIVIIRQVDFLGWTSVLDLRIESNPDLTTIDDAAFANCSRLINLTITNNAKLTSLPSNVFEGLTTLRHLEMKTNGFQQLSLMGTVSRPAMLPNLNSLDVSENDFISVQRDDLINLTSSRVRELKLNSCSLISIEPDSLRFLSFLHSLSLDDNNLDVGNISELIYSLKDTSLNFRRLSIASNILITNPFELFKSIAVANISYLSLKRSQFTNFDVNLLPPMNQLVHLDLTSIKAIASPVEFFTQEIFPSLKTLVLAKNNNLRTTFHFALPKLEKLDLSSYSSDKMCDSTYQLQLEDFQLRNLESLEVLLLNNNPLYALNSGKFDGLDNLTRLVLRCCSTYRIYPFTFVNLNKLEHLDLAFNFFSDDYALDQYSFEGLNSLKTLDLEGCAISVVKSHQFDPLVGLKSINLRNNDISNLEPYYFALQSQLESVDLAYNIVHKWEERVFVNNSKLRRVILSNNLIEELTTSMLSDFENVVQLHILDNPLVCSCSEVNLYADMKSTALINTLENEKSSSHAAKCSSPTVMMNQSYSKFILDSLTEGNCRFRLMSDTAIALSVVIPLLFMLSIVCYILRWHIKYWVFLLRQLLRCYYFPKNRNSKTGGQYRYDAFVSYSHEDRSFVVQLVAMLESHEPYLSLCVFERDFMVGGAITDSVFECLAQSRRTILILSRAFAQSRWCQWELQLAQNRKLVFKDDTMDPLIIIKMGDIDESDMTPSLRYLTKTRIYLQWNPDPIKQKLFWRKLRATLARPERIIEGRSNSVCVCTE